MCYRHCTFAKGKYYLINHLFLSAPRCDQGMGVELEKYHFPTIYALQQPKRTHKQPQRRENDEFLAITTPRSTQNYVAKPCLLSSTIIPPPNLPHQMAALPYHYHNHNHYQQKLTTFTIKAPNSRQLPPNGITPSPQAPTFVTKTWPYHAPSHRQCSYSGTLLRGRSP